LILIACNTGMRPAEMKNLRWRDMMPAKDREGREIVVLFVQGKGKSRKLVAPKSVEEYLERIRAISKATEQDDRVFTNVAGNPAKTLYSSLVADLLNEANLREGTQGVPRSTYCFRHTYATLRLAAACAAVLEAFITCCSMGGSQFNGRAPTVSLTQTWEVTNCQCPWTILYRIRPSCRSPFSVVREPRGRTCASLGHLVHAFIEVMNLHDAETQSLNHLHLKAHGIVCC
jgi:hypothetical protein